MSYIKGTYLEEIIDNAFDGLGVMLGLNERERLSDGTFKADDPSTLYVNEAWTSGKSPKKKATRKKRKAKKND